MIVVTIFSLGLRTPGRVISTSVQAITTIMRPTTIFQTVN